MQQWLASMPEDLANKVKPNILVSGGSIASMFRKEPINDFDVYIQDMDVLVAISKHYCKKNNITVYDGRLKERYIENLNEERNVNLADIFGEDDSYNMVFLRSLHSDQVKLGVDGAGIKIEIEGIEDLADDVFTPVFISHNAISLTNDIQIVTRFSGDHTEVHKNFDFIHATNYWTFNEGLVTNIAALESLLTGQLYYQGSKYPLTSVIRMKKFILRGWKISAGEILKMLFQTSMLNLMDPVVLEEQLIGVDIAYFSLLINVLNGVTKEERTPEFIIKAIDTVFNQVDLND